jgi:phosphatidylinositol-3-phosphatase
VTIHADDQGREAARPTSCPDCGSALGPDQRYCLECGTRCAPLPALVAERIGLIRKRERPEQVAEAPSSLAEGQASDKPSLEDRFMPGPRVAAVAVLGLLCFGVFLGSATSPVAQSAGIAPILLSMGSSPPPPAATTQTSAPAPAAETTASPAPASAPSQPVSEAASLFEGEAEESVPTTPATKPAPVEIPIEPALPSVKHVFMIVLADQGYEQAFGPSSPAPYLAKTLRGQGELLANYYAVAGGDLANEVALISGQGPTPQTAANCPEFTEIAPGTVASEGQVSGSGCVYPAATMSLPAQLAAAGKNWKAYIEAIGNGGPNQASTCRHPAFGALDPDQAPLPGDAYETWRNPFVYFDSLTASPECAADDVGLEQLAPDLQAASSTPSLSYIAPSACHDGSEKPCEEGQPSGLAAAEPFLQTIVPEIEASPAYKEGGLIAITSDQAPQSGPNADSSSCCGTPQYPNLSPGAVAPASGPVKASGGGGRVGLLLISPFVKAASIDETSYYDHFSLLRSIEELFGLAPLGYAANPALSGFESTVYNAESPTAGSK